MKKGSSTRPASDAKAPIFVVDDNAMLAEFAAGVLEAAGYSVKHFCDPAAALLALRDADPKPLVLVTDYEMGEMNGLQLIKSSRKLQPSLKTLMLSGTVDSSIMLAPGAKAHSFLSKPYEPQALQKAVAELLET